MAQPQETIIPFDDLPDCATDCGPLHDANGACVPPITTSVDKNCFCNHDAVKGFKTGTKGVCDNICSGGDAQKTLVAIQNWFAETCNVEKVGGGSDGGDSGDSDDSESGSSSGSKTNLHEGGQSWVEMHWRWLVMIIVLVVAIIVIWVGAFWWRRRHLRKKDLKHSLGKAPATSSWGPGAAPPEAAAIGGMFTSSGSGTPDQDSRTGWGNNKG